jgi:hypothetical protein
MSCRGGECVISFTLNQGKMAVWMASKYYMIRGFIFLWMFEYFLRTFEHGAFSADSAKPVHMLEEIL